MRDLPIFDNKTIKSPLVITNITIKTKATFVHNHSDIESVLEKLIKELRETYI